MTDRIQIRRLLALPRSVSAVPVIFTSLYSQAADSRHPDRNSPPPPLHRLQTMARTDHHLFECQGPAGGAHHHPPLRPDRARCRRVRWHHLCKSSRQGEALFAPSRVAPPGAFLPVFWKFHGAAVEIPAPALPISSMKPGYDTATDSRSLTVQSPTNIPAMQNAINNL